jgi:hypothetical protein
MRSLGVLGVIILAIFDFESKRAQNTFWAKCRPKFFPKENQPKSLFLGLFLALKMNFMRIG